MVRVSSVMNAEPAHVHIYTGTSTQGARHTSAKQRCIFAETESYMNTCIIGTCSRYGVWIVRASATRSRQQQPPRSASRSCVVGPRGERVSHPRSWVCSGRKLASQKCT